MDTPATVTHVSLCSGYGGIDLGLKRAVPALRTVAYSEIEAFACANLVAKMEARHLDAAPIWTDLKTFPWSAFRGVVDILSGGYPCQPFSTAGKKLGAADPRHLWPWILDGISVMRPRVCFFENVDGHVGRGLEEVLGDLQGLGYRGTFGLFSASEVGATHQRRRVFILAHSPDGGGRKDHWLGVPGLAHEADAVRALADGVGAGLEGLAGHGGDADSAEERRVLPQAHGSTRPGGVQLWPSRPGQPQFSWEPPRTVAYAGGARADAQSEEVRSRHGAAGQPGPLADSDGEQPERGGVAGELESSPGAQQGEARQRQRSRHSSGREGSAGVELADRDGRGLEVVGQPEFAGQQREPRDLADRCDGAQSPDADGAGQAEPSVGRGPDGSADRLGYAELCVSCDNRTDELRLLGNGVVPATAERAFRILIHR